jgi:DNA-directed RNA polymerase II subunit RPB1
MSSDYAHKAFEQDEQRQRPREKGLNDPRLGTIDRNWRCATCEEGINDCPGHFGHIELSTPVFHIGVYYTRRSTLLIQFQLIVTIGFLSKIKKLLETVCHNCGKIKANTVSHPCWDGKS